MPTLLEYAKKELQKEMIKFDPEKDNPDPIGFSEREAELCYRNNIVRRLKREAREVLNEMDKESRSVLFGYLECADSIEEDPDEEDFIPGA